MNETEKISELEKFGVPAEYASMFSPLLLGELIPKLGIYFQKLSPELTIATMPVAGNTQPAGLLHGGATAALLETVGSFAANAAAPEGKMAVGVDLNITHVSSALKGEVTATCTAEKLGRTLCVHRVEIRQGDKLISTGRISNMLVPRPSSK